MGKTIEALTDEAGPGRTRIARQDEGDGGGIADAGATDLLSALNRLCAGDFALRLEPRNGLHGQVVERINGLASLHERRTRELVRASRVIGRERPPTSRRSAGWPSATVTASWPVQATVWSCRCAAAVECSGRWS